MPHTATASGGSMGVVIVRADRACRSGGSVVRVGCAGGMRRTQPNVMGAVGSGKGPRHTVWAAWPEWC